MLPEWIEAIQFLSNVDTPALLIIFIYALHRSWIVLGKDHEQEVAYLQKQLERETKRADTWQAQALRSTNLAEWAKQVAEQSTNASSSSSSGKS
jgi:hypothetical protein